VYPQKSVSTKCRLQTGDCRMDTKCRLAEMPNWKTKLKSGKSAILPSWLVKVDHGQFNHKYPSKYPKNISNKNTKSHPKYVWKMYFMCFASLYCLGDVGDLVIRSLFEILLDNPGLGLVKNLYPVCSLHFVPSLQSAVCPDPLWNTGTCSQSINQSITLLMCQIHSSRG